MSGVIARVAQLDSLLGPATRYLAQLRLGPPRVCPGESVMIAYLGDAVVGLSYLERFDRTYSIRLDSGMTRLASGYHCVQVRSEIHGGSIRSSLWAAMRAIGQPPEMIMRFADLFSWDIDFFTEVQPGDSFKLVLEQLYADGRKVGKARLVAGQWKGKAGEYYGLFFQDPSGRSDFYTMTGECVRKGFLRSPIQYSRVTSHFSHGRLHPILRYVRPHQGVDYAARSGTPVSAIGAGVVTQCGWCGGYGRLVEINHGNGYRSRYGHLARFGRVRVGSRVGQGQVIGYVGMSGLATGPHLHFEVRVNGVPRNPLRIIPPRARPVDPRFRPQFLVRADSLVRLLKTTPLEPDSAVVAD